MDMAVTSRERVPNCGQFYDGTQWASYVQAPLASVLGVSGFSRE